MSAFDTFCADNTISGAVLFGQSQGVVSSSFPTDTDRVAGLFQPLVSMVNDLCAAGRTTKSLSIRLSKKSSDLITLVQGKQHSLIFCSKMQDGVSQAIDSAAKVLQEIEGGSILSALNAPLNSAVTRVTQPQRPVQDDRTGPMDSAAPPMMVSTTTRRQPIKDIQAITRSVNPHESIEATQRNLENWHQFQNQCVFVLARMANNTLAESIFANALEQCGCATGSIPDRNHYSRIIQAALAQIPNKGRRKMAETELMLILARF
jgi:hypothetical protein